VVSRRVYATLASVAAAAAVVGIVLVMAGRMPGAPSLQHSAPDGKVGLSAESESDAEKFPYGFSVLEECGTDYSIQNLVHSNLGGQGPNKGVEGIVYNVSETKHGVYQRNVLLKVHAKTDYSCESSHLNGMHNDFGSIRVDSGKSIATAFSFWDMQNKPITLERFRMTFFDLDSAPDGSSKEFFIADSATPEADTDGATSEVVEERVHGDQGFVAGEPGVGADNPSESTDLTQLQKDRSVFLSYKHLHSFRITLGATEGHHPRSFAFLFHNPLACDKVKVAITTTLQTTTGAPELAAGLMLWAILSTGLVLACCCSILGYLLWRHSRGAQKRSTTKTVTTVTTTYHDGWFAEHAEGEDERAFATHSSNGTRTSTSTTFG